MAKKRWKAVVIPETTSSGACSCCGCIPGAHLTWCRHVKRKGEAQNNQDSAHDKDSG